VTARVSRNRSRVVIVDAGFGGLDAARQPGRSDVDLTISDHTDHHLFQSLLYQVATASLVQSDTTGAVRHILRRPRTPQRYSPPMTVPTASAGSQAASVAGVPARG